MICGGLIIPMYNEASRGSLRGRLEDILYWVRQCNFDVVIVDDCSKDSTRLIIRQFIKQNNLNWKLICLKKNYGKGRAIMEGIKRLDTDFIGYMDADNSVNPRYLKKVYDLYAYHLQAYNFKVGIIGTRFGDGALITKDRTILRKIVSSTALTLLNLLFDLNVKDTQCGFKFFSADLLKNNVRLLYPSRWLLDVELLYLARRKGHNIIHIPVIWTNMEKESTLNMYSALTNSFRDLCILFNWRKRIK